MRRCELVLPILITVTVGTAVLAHDAEDRGAERPRAEESIICPDGNVIVNGRLTCHDRGATSLYQNAVLKAVAAGWHPPQYNRAMRIVIQITTDCAGRLIHCSMLHSSGVRSLDKSALVAVRNAKFPAAPECYKGTSITSKITLETNDDTSPQRERKTTQNSGS